MREKKFNVGNTGWLSLNSLDLRKDNDNSNSSMCGDDEPRPSK